MYLGHRLHCRQNFIPKLYQANEVIGRECEDKRNDSYITVYFCIKPVCSIHSMAVFNPQCL